MSRAIVSGSEFAVIESARVTAANTVREGMPIIIAAGTMVEATAQATAATGIAIGMEDQADPGAGPWTAIAGTMVNYVRLGSPCVVKTRVGAGGATVNVEAVCAAAGAQDYTLANGANVTTVLGVWAESGLVNDLRGLWIGGYHRCLGA